MKAEQRLVDQTAAEALQSVLEGLREELDDHRTAINENTNELQSNHEVINAVEERLDKLSARLEEIYLLVTGKTAEQHVEIQPLTKREREVFQALYVVGEGVPFVSYRQLAKKLNTSEALISGFITNLLEKGVPIVKKYDSGMAFVQLEPKFRQKQAKEVIIGLNSLLSHWIQASEAVPKELQKHL